MKAIADAIVIGSGSAGLTAAMYLRREAVNTLVIEGNPFDANNMPGGQLMLTESVEGAPGFPEVSGPELMATMRDQAEATGVEFASGEVVSADLSSTVRALHVGETEYLGRAIIVASGARPRLLGLEGENELIGYGVSMCAVCDGPLFEQKEVAVIGGGDTAFDEALVLSRSATSVTILHRESSACAAPALQSLVADNASITVRLGTTVTGYEVSDRLSGLRIHDGSGTGVIPLDGVFLAIGRVPNTEPFRSWLDVDGEGYIKTTSGTASSVDGVFACGECQDRRYRQFATAVGSGCMAGMDAASWVINGSVRTGRGSDL